jgi:hypothetical protein
MENYFYKGYLIEETSDGYYLIEQDISGEQYEFPSLDEAMDWVDEMPASAPIAKPKKSEVHTYLLFYVDNATDRAFEAEVRARSLQEAEAILRQEYDVYMITDYTVLD